MVVLYSFILYMLISLGLAFALSDEEPEGVKFSIDLIVFLIVIIVTITLKAVGFK